MSTSTMIDSLLDQRAQAKAEHQAQAEQAEAEQRTAFQAQAWEAVIEWCGDLWPALEPYVNKVEVIAWNSSYELRVQMDARPLRLAPFTFEVNYSHAKYCVQIDGHKTQKYDLVQGLEIARRGYNQMQAESERRQQQEAEKAAHQERQAALAEGYREAFAGWYAQAVAIAERNQQALDTLQQRLNEPYWTTQIHYGVMAQDDGERQIEGWAGTVLGSNGGPDMGGYRHVIEGREIVRRKFAHVYAEDAPVQRLPTDHGCKIHIHWPYGGDFTAQYTLACRPGVDVDAIREQAEALLEKAPAAPPEPNLLSNDLRQIRTGVRQGSELKAPVDDIPF